MSVLMEVAVWVVGSTGSPGGNARVSEEEDILK